MMHEFIEILNAFKEASANKKRTVLATIVNVVGSSYRKAGVQMLIDENFKTTGNISGGCIEKEVIRQSQNVLSTNFSRIVKYDGRYKLGCNGIIYILIEQFNPDKELIAKLDNCIELRQSISIRTTYAKQEISDSSFKSQFFLSQNNELHTLNKDNRLSFERVIAPLKRLYILGVEHDAEKLCHLASFLGWEVTIISSFDCNSQKFEFPDAKHLLKIQSENLDLSLFDENSAIILMTHNYAKDLRYLSKIINSEVSYIGILGSVDRREQLLNELINTNNSIEEYHFDKIHGPVGLPIGSETPEEIALSIMAEITEKFSKKSKRFANKDPYL